MDQFVFKNRINLGFALAILILLGIIAFATFSLQALIEDNNQVSRTLIVQGMLDETLALLTDAETGARGYVITGDEVFLEPYNALLTSEDGIQKHLQELRELTSDNPQQQKHLDQLDVLAANKLAIVERNIALRRNSGFDAAQAAVLSGEGRETMDEIRAVIHEMNQEESHLLEARSDAASASLKNVLLYFAIGGPFAILLISFTFYFLNQQIRERRRAEQDLQQLNQELDQRIEQRTAELAASERNYRDLADNALIGIYRSTLNGEILYVNQILASMMGFKTPEAMIQNGVVARWRDPSARKAFMDQLQRDGKVENIEYELLKSTGEPVPILITAQITGDQLTGTILDITERKQAEEALRQSEEKFSSAFRSSPAAITITRMQDGKFMDVNESACELLGYARDELLGHTSLELGIIDAEARQKNINAMREKGRIRNLESYVITRTGDKRDILLSLEMLEMNGETISFAILIDITERKQAEMHVQQLSRLYATLSQVNQTIVRVKDQDELFQAICKVSVDYGKFGLAWIGLLDRETGQVTPVAVQDTAQAQLPFQTINVKQTPFKNGLMGLAAEKDRIVYSQDIQTDANMLHWRETAAAGGFHSAAAVPFRLNGEMFGLLNLYATDENFFADEEQHLLLEELGLDISFALDTIELDARRKRAEMELKGSEERFRRLAENSPAIIYRYRFSPQPGFEYVSPAATAITGYTPEEHYNDPELGFKLVHPEDIAVLQQAAQASAPPGKPLILRWVRKDGSTIWTEQRNMLLHDEQGNVVGLEGIAIDITERKQAEQALRHSRNLLSLTGRMAQIGGWDLDLESQTLTWTDEVYRIHEVDPSTKPNVAEAINFYAPEAQPVISAAVQAGIDSGTPWDLELQLITAKGRRVWVRAQGAAERKDDKTVRLFGAFQEITERKRAEEERQQSAKLLRQIIDLVPHFIFAKDAGGRFLLVNQAVADAYGTTVSDLTGRFDADFAKSEEEVRNFRAKDMEVIGSGRSLLIPEETITDAGGHIRILQTVKIPFEFFKSQPGILGVSVDITERKRAEEERLARESAERASLAKSEFLSRMSHELRTPMNSILGFAQLLKMDELSPDQLGSLEQILKSGRHLLDLINEVLDIARIESGKITISPEPVQVHDALKSAAELMRPLADKRGIRIHIQIPSSQDIFVIADRQRLNQVLLNLLSNGVKYNRENGEIEITASLLVDGFLHLKVRDTGEGIPPEKMERLFTPFERLGLDPDMVEGTGLGLALSKGLVEAMGGRIGAQSTVGVGSTFWFDLELTTQQKEAIVMAEVDDYLRSAPGAKKGLVLYVEDNLSNIQLIEKILARLPNVELISAMQGRLALDLARQHKPGLILLDLHLPDMRGSDVLQHLRAEPETKDIPIVVLSADATHSQIERMLAAGANAYLTKPIDVKEFLNVVGEMLAG